MKKIFPTILRLCVITLSVLFSFVSFQIHQRSITTYDITTELWVKIAFIIIIAFLLGISIKKFSLNYKIEKVSTAIIIMIALFTVFFLQNKGFWKKNSEKKEREPENGSRMMKKEMASFTS